MEYCTPVATSLILTVVLTLTTSQNGMEPIGLLSASGVDSTVSTIAISSNGDVYAGGDFTVAGSVTAYYIAKWNGTTWSALGSGMNYSVRSIAISGNGDVYAGGDFTLAGEVSANYIAKWNGSTWSAMGSGMSYIVDALAINSNRRCICGWRLYCSRWSKCQLHSKVGRQRMVCPRLRHERS